MDNWRRRNPPQIPPNTKFPRRYSVKAALQTHNKKRVIQTGVDYRPPRVYDDRDGQVERFKNIRYIIMLD